MTGDRSGLGAGGVPVSRPHDPLAVAITVRMARAALGWSQVEFGRRLGITQRSVHRIEQGHSEPRLTTLLAIESLLGGAGLKIEHRMDGGLCMIVPASVLGHRAAVDVAAPSLSDCGPPPDQEETEVAGRRPAPLKPSVAAGS
jgi:transcriptional regulator with XRE-family HTH domain